MAQRIRTIKPDLFKHEGLYDLEVETGLPIRLIFAGIWTLADREGRFKWRPRAMRAEAFPFDSWDMGQALDALATRGFLVKYACEREEYGYIPGWPRHQFVNGKEGKSLIPAPPAQMVEVQQNVLVDASVTREDRDSHATTTHGVKEGKGREGKDLNTPPLARETEPPFEQVEDSGYPEGMPVAAMVQELFARTAQAQPFGVVALASKAVEAIAKHENESLPRSAYLLEARIRSATRAGETINRFWFEDGRWKKREGGADAGTAGNQGNRKSPAAERVSSTQRAIRNAALAQGWGDAGDPADATGDG